jgi:hypothetical protein
MRRRGQRGTSDLTARGRSGLTLWLGQAGRTALAFEDAWRRADAEVKRMGMKGRRMDETGVGPAPILCCALNSCNVTAIMAL